MATQTKEHSTQSEPLETPDVKMNQRGVFYVEASDVLRSERGKELIRRTGRYRATHGGKARGPR